jgi:hypothetical protein
MDNNKKVRAGCIVCRNTGANMGLGVIGAESP